MAEALPNNNLIQRKCAIVGHSQVIPLPMWEIANQGHVVLNNPLDYQLFYRRGATTSSLYSDPTIRREIAEYDPDIIVIFLGSNDLDTTNYNYVSHFVIKDQLKRIGNHLRLQTSNGKARLYYMTIEQRLTPAFVSQDTYRRRRNKVNETLKKERALRLIFNDMSLDRIGRDGIHFLPEWYRGVAWKIRRKVEDYAIGQGW